MFLSALEFFGEQPKMRAVKIKGADHLKTLCMNFLLAQKMFILTYLPNIAIF